MKSSVSSLTNPNPGIPIGDEANNCWVVRELWKQLADLQEKSVVFMVNRNGAQSVPYVGPVLQMTRSDTQLWILIYWGQLVR